MGTERGEGWRLEAARKAHFHFLTYPKEGYRRKIRSLDSSRMGVCVCVCVVCVRMDVQRGKSVGEWVWLCVRGCVCACGVWMCGRVGGED